MPSRIMARQLPSIIEGEENMGPFAPSSELSAGQTSSTDGNVLPGDAITIVSDSKIPEEELPKLESENQDNDPSKGPNRHDCKKKRYHRHTQNQLQELEAFFKVCPHPDDKQRKQLGCDLGLEPLQVKFWFQNKRTQIKTYYERANNEQLKAENEKLRAENIKYKESITKAYCPTCEGAHAIGDISLDKHQLRVENARLREEVERITCLVAKFVSKPYDNFTLESPSIIPCSLQVEEVAFRGQPDNAREINGEDELLRSLAGPTEFDKSMILEIAVSAIEEVIKMSEMDLPLWIQTMDNRKYVLNEDAYYHMFPRAIGLKLACFKTEASRDTDIIMMHHMNLIEVFMDMDKWTAMFASMVSRALVLQVISTGVEPGNYNGALKVISTEFQVLTPTIPTRECIFIRHCQQLAKDTWAVIDVSCDSLFSYMPLAKCQRRPSGCIIQAMPNGCSKVTWIEHVGVEDKDIHYLGRAFVESGLAFGAQRWVAVLSRQCERLASLMVTNFSPEDINDTVLTYPEARKNILKLSEMMTLNFCGGVTSSTTHSWMNFYPNGNEKVRIMTKKNENYPGNPSGTVLNATTCFWIPVPQKIVFEFLCDESTRSEWDILCSGGSIQELVHITNGQKAGNCVSLMRGSNLSQGDLLILQECSSDPTGSSVIYAPVDNINMKQLLDGGNPEHIAVLPSGFTIFPSGAPTLIQGRTMWGAGTVGSLVTISFQILADSVFTTRLPFTSLSVINGLLEATTDKIKAILAPNSA
ncbi:hypothetical protein ACH5RR_029159 [Cinchona calisaya]|uniref:Uncharacterized protein n=1 Tax=Cinchona calisaya TaxID=153742 RepID=A0ABD2YQX5_9GENT